MFPLRLNERKEKPPELDKNGGMWYYLIEDIISSRIRGLSSNQVILQ
jgi:hypothetical protein